MADSNTTSPNTTNNNMADSDTTSPTTTDNNIGQPHQEWADLVYHLGPDPERSDICIVCMCEVEEDEESLRHTTCKNTFHTACLESWLEHLRTRRQLAKCPTCSTTIAETCGSDPRASFNRRFQMLEDFYCEMARQVWLIETRWEAGQRRRINDPEFPLTQPLDELFAERFHDALEDFNTHCWDLDSAVRSGMFGAFDPNQDPQGEDMARLDEIFSRVACVWQRYQTVKVAILYAKLVLPLLRPQQVEQRE